MAISNVSSICSTTLSRTQKTLNAGGMNSTEVNSVFSTVQNATSGDPTASLKGIVNGAVDDPVANAAINGGINIVKAVLTDQYQVGEPSKEAQNEKGIAQDVGNTSQNNATQALSEAENKTNETQENADEKTNQIKVTADQIILTNEDGSQEILQLDETNKQLAAKITENEPKIIELDTQLEAKRQEREKIQEEIRTLQEQEGAEIIQNETPPANGNNGGVQGEGEGQDGNGAQTGGSGNTDGSQKSEGYQCKNYAPMSCTSTNPKVQALISKYNEIGNSMNNLETQKKPLIDENENNKAQILENSTAIEAKNTEKEETTTVNQENLDQLSNEVNNAFKEAGGAVKELKGLVSGNLNSFNKMSKAQIVQAGCGIVGHTAGVVEIGAAIVAANGSAVVSCGATADKIAKLVRAEGSELNGVAQYVATELVEKQIQQLATNYINQSLQDISKKCDVDLAGMSNDMLSMIGDTKSSVTASNEEYKTDTKDVKLEAPKEAVA